MAILPQTITGGGVNHTAVQRLAGFSLKEDASATAFVRLRAGSVSGQILFEISFAADESASIVFPKGVFLSAAGGTFLQEASGSVEGVLFYVS